MYTAEERHVGHPDDGRQSIYDDDGWHEWHIDNEQYQNLTEPISIDMALRQNCRIPVKRFFLAIQTEDDSMKYMHSQHKLDECDVFNSTARMALSSEQVSKYQKTGMLTTAVHITFLFVLFFIQKGTQS